MELPEDGFDTIGGLVAHQLGRVPRRGEAVEAGGLRFAVMLARGGAVRWFRVARVGNARQLRTQRLKQRRARRAAAAGRAVLVCAGVVCALGALQTLAFVHTGSGGCRCCAPRCLAGLVVRVRAGAAPQLFRLGVR